MDNEDREIRVTVADDDEPEIRPRTLEPSASQADDSQIAAERAARLAAQREQVEAYRVATQREGELAQIEYERSFESGDVKGLTAATKKISEAAVRERNLEELAENLKAQPADPVEAWISQKAPEAQKWLRANREFVTNPKLNARLNSAHYDAISEGIEVNSPRYFEAVERRIGLRNGGGTRHVTSGEKSRIDPNDFNSHDLGGGQVFLTAGERKAAVDGTIVHGYGPKRGEPVGLAEMARRKAALIKQGAYRKLDQ